MSSVTDMYEGNVSDAVRDRFNNVKDYMADKGNNVCSTCGTGLPTTHGCAPCPTCGNKGCGE